MVWGKLLGGFFGFLVGGPLGVVLGAALGHSFDKGMAAQLTHESVEMPLGDSDRVRMAFFTATFSVMGHIAKADGRVAKSEIELAEAVMQRMNLNEELRDAAIKLFNQGKQADFELEPLLAQFKHECRRRSSLYRMLLEIQIQAALADGVIADEEEKVLLRITQILGFPEYVYRQLEMLVSVSMGMGDQARARAGRQSRSENRAPQASTQVSLNDAYALLGVSASDEKADVKRAYRRMMSQHHPDKLVSKGLPEEMIKLATDKTQNIQKAYERIKEARGWP